MEEVRFEYHLVEDEEYGPCIRVEAYDGTHHWALFPVSKLLESGGTFGVGSTLFYPDHFGDDYIIPFVERGAIEILVNAPDSYDITGFFSEYEKPGKVAVYHFESAGVPIIGISKLWSEKDKEA